MFIALVQFNPKTGALRENSERALKMIDELAGLSYPPDLVVFPAFALSGAELGGLLAHNAFAAEALDVTQDFIKRAALPTLIGTVLPRPAMGKTRFICEEEVIFAMKGKGSPLGFLDMNTSAELQEYVESIQIKLAGCNIAVVLDDYIDPDARYNDCDVIISMIARPFQDTNGLLTASGQIDSLRADAISNNTWIVVASLAGGEDSFVYEGASLVISPEGMVVESAPPFEEDVFTVNLSISDDDAKNSAEKEQDLLKLSKEKKIERFDVLEARKLDKKRILPLLPHEANWRALQVGLRDYVQKSGFTDVVLGLSGGVDSAVVATLATDALGSEHVHGIMMPSQYSSSGSISDSEALASNLGIKTLQFPIQELFNLFKEKSEQYIGTIGSDVSLQNLQSRFRTVILMHLSNTYGWLLLNTGNKSEAAMGYSTLYGDTAGAIAPLGSVYKTDVYGMANWRNSKSMVIPKEILTKEPSAELYEGQKDSDSLPPYDELDQILRLHIEENLGVDEILEFFSSYPIKTDIDAETILSVLKMIKNAEFKRRQEPMAFCFDGVHLNDTRSWPITNGFEDHSRDIISPNEILNYLGGMYRGSGPDEFNLLDN